jgi:hypothetical protein
VIEGWFNVAAFANQLSTGGQLRAQHRRRSGYRASTLSLFRDIRLKGRTMFQFRVEATNVFNMVNLNNPGDLSAPATFGKIRARNMRQVQLGGRFSF